MRRALALALVAGLAYGGWRFWQSGALGGGPSAGASWADLEGYKPSGLRAEMEDRAAAKAIGGLGFRPAYRQSSGAQVLNEIPVKALADRVALLETSGHADLVQGIYATAKTTPADRKVLAEAACRRAANVAGMPATRITACARALESGPSFNYRPAGSRLELSLDLFAKGLGDTTAAR